MASASRRVLVWSPRILGILVAVFFMIFSLDVFGEGKSLGPAILAFLIHNIPSFALLAVVALSWRRPWIGGSVFVALGVFYAVITTRHPDWILAISGPLFVVGMLFFLSWRRGGKAERTSEP